MAQLTEFFTNRTRIRFPPAAFHVGDDAFIGMSLNGTVTLLDDVKKLNGLFARPIQNAMADVFRQLFEGGIQIEVVMGGQAREQSVGKGIPPVPTCDSAACQAEIRKCHDATRIKNFHTTQAVAGGAGTGRVIEAEQPRLHLCEAMVAEWAGIVAGKGVFLTAIHVERDSAAFCKV